MSKIRILIVCEGGQISQIASNHPEGIQVDVIDYATHGDPTEIHRDWHIVDALEPAVIEEALALAEEDNEVDTE